MAVSIASVWLREAEVPASEVASTSCYDLTEHIIAFAMVESELKLGKVKPQTLFAHMMIGSYHTALQETPKAFDTVRVNDATLARAHRRHRRRLDYADRISKFCAVAPDTARSEIAESKLVSRPPFKTARASR
jgi:hypothetical protein